ncbi:hypothetical protein NE237_019727 [Protea cynaroides]|uniref:Uncharacterized protein n=1 Tax=Protea cynaroides TaxID=273540 RepID=A0A9Q0H990_9MAGN|nr:hypothetical protein NE237_019727 [Protea cynaroides]
MERKVVFSTKMKKCFSYLSNSQLQPCEQKEPRLGMFNGRSFPSSDVRRAWELVCKGTDGANEMEIRKTYTKAVTAVDEQARNIYKEDPFNQVPVGDEFLQIMIDQGCFILQVILFSLGVSEKLNDDWSKHRVKAWVTSLFCIRNQLPLVVLKEIMKQSFFKELLKSRKKWRRPKDMARMVFYDQLVEPMLEGPGHKVNFMKQIVNGVIKKSMGFSDQEPPTLLHALWLHQTGPGPIVGNIEDEVGDEDDESCSSWYTVRSATELQNVEITFKNNKGKGIRGIEFKRKMIDADLCLPSITIEPNTEILFKHLIDYEEEIDLGKNQREVCSYLKLMRELVRTPDDAKVLAMQGIVNADPEGERNLPEILKGLPLPDMVGDNQHMVDVRRKIRSYVKPSIRGKVVNLLVFTVILSLLQDIYAVLSYHYPRKG